MRVSRFMPAATVAVAVSLAAAGCATTPPPVTYITAYDCSETLETADGRFRAEEAVVWWGRDLADGVSVQLAFSMPGEAEQAGFATRGFAGRDYGHPMLSVDYDSAHGRRNYWLDGVPHMEVAGELRLGSRSRRQWMPVNMTQSLGWAEAMDWLAAEPAGDFVFTVYDTAGTRLQGATLPRDALARAEETLKTLHARVRSKAAAKETLCKVSVYPETPDIIV